MKNIILFLVIFFGIKSLLFSQDSEYLTFEHRALSLNIRYSTIWNKYWYYDNYSNVNYSDLSQNEIDEMIRRYRYYPIFYIKRYDEIYNGINPSIRITLQPHNFYNISYRDLLMIIYSEDHEALIINTERIDIGINLIKTILSYGKDITQEINLQNIGNRSVLHFQTEDYVLNSSIIDDNFYRITEYYLLIENDYIMVIELNYSRTINNNDKNELMEILENIIFR